MARPLTVLAVGGLAISVVCLSLAGGFASDDPLTIGFPLGDHLGWRVIFGDRCTATPKGDATATSRDFAWDGDDSVEIDIPADVHYQPGPGRKVTVRGEPETLRHVQVNDGTIEFDCDWKGGNAGMLDVTLPGRDMRSFAINGSGHLFIENIQQDQLRIGIHGSGDVRGNGQAERLDLTIAGSGNADFGQLSVKRLRVVIAGSGNADAAPQEDADVVIAGSGEVHLHRQPKHLSQKVVGSGRVVTDTSI